MEVVRGVRTMGIRWTLFMCAHVHVQTTQRKGGDLV